MSGNDSFSRSASRHRSSFFDDDDDDEPFEQAPPPGLFPESVQLVAGANPRAGHDIRSADTYARSSETRGRRFERRPRSDTRDTRDVPVSSDAGTPSASPPVVSSFPTKSPSKPKRTLRGRALAYLSRREHSRDELARKLTRFVDETDGEDAVSAVLDRLAAEGWLSDTRFAQSVVNRRAGRFGTSRIVGELKRHKVDSDTVQSLSEGLRDTEWERISAVWARKFGTLAVTPQERAKQARFLASRGFSSDAVMRIIKSGDDSMLGEE